MLNTTKPQATPQIQDNIPKENWGLLPEARKTKLALANEESPEKQASNFVTALERGLAVLNCFDVGRRKMSLTQIAAITNLSRGTARRFLLTLETLGYVASEGRMFRLTPRVLQLAKAYYASDGLAEIARPFIQWVTEETGECSSLAVLDGPDIVYLARIETRRIFSSGLAAGSRLPAHCASLGHVLLAAMEPDKFERWLIQSDPRSSVPNVFSEPERLRSKLRDVRELGYALCDGEIEVGCRSIAVPILDPAGRTIAALNVGTLAARVSLERMCREFLPVLRTAAREIGTVAAGL